MDVIRRFAEALDADDYVTGSACLEPDAHYDSGEKHFSGRDAIIESFRSASKWGHDNLDDLQFLHEIQDETPLQIRFIDVIVLRGERFVLDHTMHVLLSDNGLIASLRLEYPPGERERVRVFFKRHGL